MNESDVRLAVTHALQWHGWWPFHHQDGRRYFCALGHPVLAKAEIKGRPDIEARHPLFPTAFIECKVVGKNDKAFKFDQIEPEQREYLDNWTAEGGMACIAIGKILPAGSRTKIGGIVVVPWTWWLNIEKGMVKSIAWDWDLYEKKPVDWAYRKSITNTVMYHHQLDKVKGDGWQFPGAHPLATPKRVEVPFYMREKVRVNGISQSEQVPASD